MRSAMHIATMPEIPHPSSSRVDSQVRQLVAKRGFLGAESHAANKGLIFQRTAPVVPVLSEELSRVGDWLMVRSRPAEVRANSVALGSRKPRFRDAGRFWLNRTNDSDKCEQGCHAGQLALDTEAFMERSKSQRSLEILLGRQ